MPRLGEPYRPPVLYMGIDPGASGGIVVRGNGYLQVYKMPEDEYGLWNLISKYGWMYDAECGRLGKEPTNKVYAILEQVGGFMAGTKNGVGFNKASAHTMFNFGKGYGQLLAFLVAANIRFETVVPRVWQKAMGIEPKGKQEKDTAFKNRIKEVAVSLYPNTKVTKDVSDAMVIAAYCECNAAELFKRKTREVLPIDLFKVEENHAPATQESETESTERRGKTRSRRPKQKAGNGG